VIVIPVFLLLLLPAVNCADSLG